MYTCERQGEREREREREEIWADRVCSARASLSTDGLRSRAYCACVTVTPRLSSHHHCHVCMPGLVCVRSVHGFGESHAAA